MKPIIKIENISKQYRLGEVGTGSLKDDLKRWWYSLRGLEDPFLKIGDINDRTKKGKSDYVWALKDINFEVMPGDVMGIIGKNGAGKSTLLKILSKITGPTTGKIDFNGRIASLLEVGTGFHPELSGRENIYLNGAILGMTKREIHSKIDAIIDFSGCENYIDTPVKRYSSGMMVRLGFSVAAHLEPEILIVDEVLAVGDLDFQKKAIGKMKEVSQSEGRTVLFVSHSMPSIRNLCTKGILLLNGSIAFQGSSADVIDFYTSNVSHFKPDSYTLITNEHRNYIFERTLEFYDIKLLNAPNGNQFAVNEFITVEINIYAKRSVNDFRIALGIFNLEEVAIGTFFGKSIHSIQKGATKKLQITVSNHQLAKGQYYFDFSVGIGNEVDGFKDFDHISKTIYFEIAYKDNSREQMITVWHKNWGNINFQEIKIKELS